jgi:hypothetical protein
VVTFTPPGRPQVYPGFVGRRNLRGGERQLVAGIPGEAAVCGASTMPAKGRSVELGHVAGHCELMLLPDPIASVSPTSVTVDTAGNS